MKLCGLTGGVGMGKSTAAGFFSASGICVIDTDELARQVVLPGQPALAEIHQAFGGEVFDPAGGLHRARLARLVFGDAAARQTLEAILHPRIRALWLAQVASWRRQGCPLAVVVIPLLFETQAETCFDQVICVACSRVAQHERLRQRGWSPEQIRQRLAAQWPVAQKMARADFVLWSEGALASCARQVARILGRL